MGGFAGGDEGGYWDEESVPTSKNKKNANINREKLKIDKNDSSYSIKAHAKVNIFLKFTDFEDTKETLLSRVVRVDNLYDTISFIPCKCKAFTIEGCDEIPLESNTIYKAYTELINSTIDSDIEEFFTEHKVVVTKNIPISSGLGGASSNAAAFILLAKEICNLILSTNELIKIGTKIARDVPFFIYNYSSANVSSCGEVVEQFEEQGLNFDFYKPNIVYDKTNLHNRLKKDLLIDLSLASNWSKLDSRSILELAADPLILNDLYASLILLHPELKEEVKNKYFFSGSGPTFFKLLN
ncbi:4-(cytidine 5'-diphospho)-2-C-methyl-D-erythritol kinase [Sulfurimonas aquatica]|uniref:4-(Cytidine 5'-diphospho)-2-C-methyl-D-erythritol kinase n=1 Tax=Sulfurimonas aquatica TaxID=2672570 RepID=A0A975B1Q4_9BACT|nr:4-(cytidine 5'-diphospho)-2-C-methyl-D-erythritol kinase [Sulfurimonas aquatica]QSZ42619.1 4-(cytidine 5'-diphospho)-2-C-methyl-D-erythritol kinase [Sulfurimonas aquatica]